MAREWTTPIKGDDEPGQDARIAGALRALDPAAAEPNYWFRLHAKVMKGARPELARRRMMADVTVGDVLASWARAVVPAAVVAAAIAGLVLMRASPGPAPTPVGVEELLLTGIGDATIPATLGAPGVAVTFANERF